MFSPGRQGAEMQSLFEGKDEELGEKPSRNESKLLLESCEEP